MNKKNITNIQSDQITIFDAYGSPSFIKKMVEKFDKNFTRNIINLRQELKHDIPNTTYLTHAIHNFYPAKFIPQVPRFVIKLFDLKGKIILDPFAGSGTTAVESLITGNSNISNDINPITKFLIDVKTLKLDPENYSSYVSRLNQHIKQMFKSDLEFVPRWDNINYWYEESILLVLKKIWGYIHNINQNENDIKNILSASALYLSRRYSYGDDGSPKLFKSKQKMARMKELTNKFHEFGEELLQKELFKRANEYLDRIIHLNLIPNLEQKRIISLEENGDKFLMVLDNSIEDLEKILPEGKIDCIITSPPYIYAQEYFRSTKIDMYWLDIIDDESIRRLTKKEIGQKFKPCHDLKTELLKIESYKNSLKIIEKLSNNFKTKENVLRFDAYFNDMLYFVRLSVRLLAKNGILAIFIGEPRVYGHHIKTKDIISEMMIQNNFYLKHTFFDIIKSRHLSKNRLNENPNGISGEWLIIGEKL